MSEVLSIFSIIRSVLENSAPAALLSIRRLSPVLRLSDQKHQLCLERAQFGKKNYIPSHKPSDFGSLAVTRQLKLAPLGRPHLHLSKSTSFLTKFFHSPNPTTTTKLDRLKAFRGRPHLRRSHSSDAASRRSLREPSPHGHSLSWFSKMRRSESATKRGRSPTESPPDASSITSPNKRQELPPKLPTKSAPASRDQTPLFSRARSNTPSATMPEFLNSSPQGKKTSYPRPPRTSLPKTSRPARIRRSSLTTSRHELLLRTPHPPRSRPCQNRSWPRC